MRDEALIDLAVRARNRAYAPYSQFAVGAALLGKSGTVYTGANIENASYGLTMCAERVAVGVAASAGEFAFEAMVISLKGGGAPCGACRQVLNEFSPEMRVVMTDLDGIIVREMTIGELLPEGFGPTSL